MGYAVYFREGRWAGYGVPAVCDQPECDEEIDRGLDYICGDEPGGERGCGLYFCGEHLYYNATDGDPAMCERCCNEEPAFDPKPDAAQWVSHMLTHDSWQEWRDENPAQVEAMKAQVA